jgi:hypothetical protein
MGLTSISSNELALGAQSKILPARNHSCSEKFRVVDQIEPLDHSPTNAHDVETLIDS